MKQHTTFIGQIAASQLPHDRCPQRRAIKRFGVVLHNHVVVVTALAPDDTWRDIVAVAPGLSELRQHLKSRQGADMESEITGLQAAGKLSDPLAEAMLAECR